MTLLFVVGVCHAFRPHQDVTFRKTKRAASSCSFHGWPKWKRRRRRKIPLWDDDKKHIIIVIIIGPSVDSAWRNRDRERESFLRGCGQVYSYDDGIPPLVFPFRFCCAAWRQSCQHTKKVGEHHPQWQLLFSCKNEHKQTMETVPFRMKTKQDEEGWMDGGEGRRTWQFPVKTSIFSLALLLSVLTQGENRFHASCRMHPPTQIPSLILSPLICTHPNFQMDHFLPQQRAFSSCLMHTRRLSCKIETFSYSRGVYVWVAICFFCGCIAQAKGDLGPLLNSHASFFVILC